MTNPEGKDECDGDANVIIAIIGTSQIEKKELQMAKWKSGQKKSGQTYRPNVMGQARHGQVGKCPSRNEEKTAAFELSNGDFEFSTSSKPFHSASSLSRLRSSPFC